LAGATRRRRLLLGALAVAGCGIAAAAGTTAPAPGKTGPLSGRTKIRKIELLKLTRGPHRGALLVWADVFHGSLAPGATPSGRARNLGLLRVELRSARGSGSGADHVRLPVAGPPQAGRPEHGYRVLIPSGQAKALGSGPVELLARASQSLDLNGDGVVDARNSETQRARLKPNPVEQPLFPRPGAWSYSDPTTTYVFNTDTVSVTVFSAFSKTGGCMIQDPMHAPVDPVTGSFHHNDGEVDIGGQFTAAGTASVTGTVAVSNCYQDQLNNAIFSLAQ
jgi:hypothetical protein